MFTQTSKEYGVDRSVQDHLTFSVEGVVAVLDVTVGLVHPVGAALDHGAAAVEVVVIK